MANYNLNILRNSTVYSSRESAIDMLDGFEHHSYGQPMTVLYKDNGEIRLMFVVGIKNASDSIIHCGRDFYEIINDVPSSVDSSWKTYLNGEIVNTDEVAGVVSVNATDFAAMLAHWDEQYSAFNDYIFFVNNGDSGMIYKGKILYSGGGGGGGYILPIASKTTLGGVKVGDNLSIDSNGVLDISAEGGVAQQETLVQGIEDIRGDIDSASSAITNNQDLLLRFWSITDGTNFIPATQQEIVDELNHLWEIAQNLDTYNDQ